MIIPQPFLWSDGPRPSQSGIDEYAHLPVRLNIQKDILQVQDPGNNDRWPDDVLLGTTRVNKDNGTQTVWMLWAWTLPDKCREDIEYLDRMFSYGMIPAGVQWDCEEQFDEEGPYQECAQILNDGCAMLNEKYDVDLEYSITAGTAYPHPRLRPHIEFILGMPLFTVGYSMSYMFYNHADGHWSHDLPEDPDETVRLTALAWIDAVERGLIVGCFIGLAAYFQDFPESYDLPPYDAMRQCICTVYDLWDEYPGTILGMGHWSRKHITDNEAKQRMIYNLTQDLRTGRELTPLPPAYPNPVRELQIVLTDAGYDPGPVDGEDGPKTQAAAQQYKEEQARVLPAMENGADELIEEIYGD